MLEFNFNPFSNLETERLLLRRITMHDAKEIFAHRSDVNAMKYIGKPLAEGLEDAINLIRRMDEGINNNNSIAWGICLKGEEKIIGSIGYYRINKDHHRGEIGYMIGTEHWGKGIVTEAMKVTLDFGFNELKFHSVEAMVDPDNLASIRVLEKQNFVKEAHFKEDYFFNNKFLDTAVYSLLRSLR